MKFKLILSFLVLINAGLLAQHKGSVSGTVKTSDGKPAGYVTVSLKNTNRGTSTNSSGQYEIKNIPAGAYTLVASFVGLETKTQEIEVRGGEAVVIPEIVLNEG